MNLLDKVVELESEANDFGFSWENGYQIIAQIKSECVEVCEHLKDGISEKQRIKLQEEIGDLLHAVLSLCVFCKYDPKETLEQTLLKFDRRLHSVKQLAEAKGFSNVKGQSFDVLMQLWNQAKKKVG